MEVEVKITGLTELRRDFAAAGGNADRVTKAAVSNSVNRVQSEVRKRAAHRTGTLQRSVLVYIKGLMGIVQVNEKYGIFLEQGTGIYGPEARPIRPVNAKALVFKIGGNVIFAKEIKGIRAKPFFAPGIKAAQSYVDAQFTRVLQLITKGLAGRGYE